DVDLGEGLVSAGAKLFPRLLEPHGVGAGISGPQASEGAKQTTGHADIRGLDADVEVVIRQVSVPPFALPVGQCRHVEQIGMLEKPNAVFEGQTFPVGELLGNLGEGHALRSYQILLYCPALTDVSPVTTRSG